MFWERNDFDQIIQKTLNTNIAKANKLKDKKIKLETKVIIEQVLLNEKIKALSEMKIVYAFKNFEISLKHFLQEVYPDFSPQNAFREKYIVAFLKTKNINFKEIVNYKELKDLREINNSIKHSSIEYTKNIENIIEFKGKTIIEYEDILNYYERIKNINIDFFKDLRLKILSNSEVELENLLY